MERKVDGQEGEEVENIEENNEPEPDKEEKGEKEDLAESDKEGEDNKVEEKTNEEQEDEEKEEEDKEKCSGKRKASKSFQSITLKEGLLRKRGGIIKNWKVRHSTLDISSKGTLVRVKARRSLLLQELQPFRSYLLIANQVDIFG